MCARVPSPSLSLSLPLPLLRVCPDVCLTRVRLDGALHMCTFHVCSHTGKPQTSCHVCPPFVLNMRGLACVIFHEVPLGICNLAGLQGMP